MKYLRANWPWLLLPFVVVAILLGVAYYATFDSVAPFTYALE